MLIFPRLSRLLYLSIFLTWCTACGSSYETLKIKEYTLAVLNDDPAIKQEFRNLIIDFNHFAGLEALQYVESSDDANSAIILTKGLRDRDGKVGWGQWIAESEEDNPITAAFGKKSKRTITYSMRLEFDEDYFRKRLANPDSKKLYQKQKLFFHEAGHGLEMAHAEQKSDVMYFDISGNKDFDVFFGKVRSYMADQ